LSGPFLFVLTTGKIIAEAYWIPMRTINHGIILPVNVDCCECASGLAAAKE